MANIQLYQFSASPPCRSVRMTAKALGVPLELKQLDFANKEHLSPEFLKDIFQGNATYPAYCNSDVEYHWVTSLVADLIVINPDQIVPTMTDGDFTLWESRAIMRYLVGKFGGEDNSLYPRDLQKRAEVDRLLDYDLGVFYRAMLETLMWPVRNRSTPTKEQNEQVVKAFNRIDTLLKDKQFLTGDNVTIADFAMVVGFAAEFLFPGNMADYPNAMAWYKRMQELPYYQEVNQAFYDIVEKMRNPPAEKS